MLIIGLTGGIGSGKTAVSDIFSELGVPILDADIAAREVVAPGSPALAKICAHFGTAVIDASGELDRAALRKIVFADKSALGWLESLTHPLIREHLQHALAQLDAPYAIIVSPLLLETDQHQMVDRVLVIDVPEELQLQRAMARDENQADQIKRIMASQSDRQTRLSKANDVISNDADFTALESKVAALHQNYLTIARQQ